MNADPNNSNDRVEGMLRRWGADEAARTTPVPAAPGRPVRRKRRPSPVWRWIPLAAAALLTLAAAGLFVASLGERSAAERAATEDRAELGRVRTSLDKANATVATAATELNASREESRKQADRAVRAEARTAELQTLLDGSGGSLTEATKLVASMQKSLDAKGKQIEDLSASVSSLEKEVAAADKALAESRGKTRTDPSRQAAAMEELNRMRDMHSQALAAERKVRGELQILAARKQAMWADFQRAYLSAAAPGDVGLAARQAAARRSSLVKRCGALQRDVTSEPTRKLFDKLEAVLTRLDLLDPYEPRSVKSFTTVVRGGGLLGEIDASLASRTMTDDVRAWLFETRAILMGADRVG
jgi:uncharacterized protein YlxW (UPF0749 family)